MQAPVRVLVEFKSCRLQLLWIWDVVVILIKQTCRFPSEYNFSVIQNYNSCSGVQATHKTASSTCNVLLSSFLQRSNGITLQTLVYRVFNYANWPIKNATFSLCSKYFLYPAFVVLLLWKSSILRCHDNLNLTLPPGFSLEGWLMGVFLTICYCFLEIFVGGQGLDGGGQCRDGEIPQSPH